jgi:MoaA/NifB/PqqE/SkfB family radical SAM enzyme
MTDDDARIRDRAADAVLPPVFVNLLVGGRCRLRCPFCRAWREDKAEMPAAAWAKFFADLAAWVPGRAVTLSGGEPLHHPEFERIVRAAADAGLPVNVATAGEPLDDALVRAFPTWPVHGVALSLDGPEAAHDRLRGRAGLFRRSLDALDYFKEVRPGLRTTTATVISRTTLPGLRDLAEFLIAKPQVDRVYFQAIMVFGETERWAAPETLPDWPDAAEALSFLDWLDARRATAPKLVNSAGQVALWRRYFAAPARLFDAVDACHVGRYTLTVKSDGSASLCDFHDPIGNVAREDVRALWEGGAARARRRAMGACRLPCVYLVNCSFEDVHVGALPEAERAAYRRLTRAMNGPGRGA